MHQPHQLLRRLAEAGVDFVVVGGYAAVIHGSAYVTNDLDLCTVLSPDNLDRIRRALADELLFGRLVDGGRLSVDIDDKDEVLLDIQPPKKSDKPRAEAAAA